MTLRPSIRGLPSQICAHIQIHISCDKLNCYIFHRKTSFFCIVTYKRMLINKFDYEKFSNLRTKKPSPSEEGFLSILLFIDRQSIKHCRNAGLIIEVIELRIDILAKIFDKIFVGDIRDRIFFDDMIAVFRFHKT